MGLRAQSARVLLRWSTHQSIPLAGALNVYRSAAGESAIDWAAGPLNPAPIDAWPTGIADGKMGFGLGLFGSGPFGRGEGGRPFGDGRFGDGEFGFGGWPLTFLTPPLADGAYRFAVVPVDEAGNEDRSAAAIVAATVAGVPAAPLAAAVTAYADGAATVSWTPSPENIESA